MNWIYELCDLYDKNIDIVGKFDYIPRKGQTGEERIPIVLLPVFHTTVAAQITVDISEEGNFLRARIVLDGEKMTVIPVTETSGSRTAGIEPHPFCDNLKYLAGDYMKYVNSEKKDFSENHRLYMEELKKWHHSEYTHKKVDALYAYLEKNTLIADLVNCGVLILDDSGKLSEKVKIQIVSQADAFVRFCIIEKIDISCNLLKDETGKYASECWLDRTLQESYISYYRSVLTEKGLCYLTGENTAISYLQPKKIRNEGDGAKLISSNDESNFTYRGRFRDKKEAFSIGYENSQKAHNALKWIIRKQGFSWDSLCIVVWESDFKPIPDWNLDTDGICEEYEGWGDEEQEENRYYGTGEATAVRFQKAMKGYGNVRSDTDSKVILLAFDSATTGRLAMIENKMFESSRYVENIRYWHDSCRWLHAKYKDGHRFPYMGMAGVKDIADALYGTEQKGMLSIIGKTKMYGEICKRLLPCIADRKRIPADLVNLAVQRASSPLSFENRYNWEKVLSVACSFVKKQIAERNQGKEENREEWSMEVNTLTCNRDYLYGRLLAVADRIEYRTYDREKDGKRVTNAKRYMKAFSQRPYQTWQKIEESLDPYLRKLDLPERTVYMKLLDEISSLFKPEDFVDNSRLEGLYLLGFHSQSNALRYKEESKEEK